MLQDPAFSICVALKTVKWSAQLGWSSDKLGFLPSLCCAVWSHPPLVSQNFNEVNGSLQSKLVNGDLEPVPLCIARSLLLRKLPTLENIWKPLSSYFSDIKGLIQLNTHYKEKKKRKRKRKGMQLHSSPHSLLTPSLGLRRAFHVHNFEFKKEISWVGCIWMLSCKDKVTMVKWAPCFPLPFLTPGNSKLRAPKLKQRSKIELNQVQAAARVNPTDCHSSKPEITWWVICY